MTVGYILISIAPAKEQAVHEALASIDEITELYSLFGPYDVIAKVAVDSEDVLASVVLNHIRPIDGVADTKTHTVVPLEQLTPGQEASEG
ncbi:MAG: Lrp/AsnC ligand binding domain-containing protein [Thermoplasmatota archaeon]